MLTVLTPAGSGRLCLVDDLKLELTLTGATDDALLAHFIEAASAAISDYCHRDFRRQGYRETVRGYGDPYLQLARYPLVTVTQVLLAGDPITDYTVDDAEAGILLRKGGWVWTTGVGWNLTPYVVPRSEAPEFQVDYTAGYLMPDETGPTLPRALRQAAINLAKEWYLGRQDDQRLTSKKVDDLALTYREPVAGADASVATLPPQVAALVAPYVAGTHVGP